MYAAVRVRGNVDLRKEIRDTFKILKLERVNHCILLPENNYSKGMLNKVKDWITWGRISDGMVEELVEKKGRMVDGSPVKGKGMAKKISKGTKAVGLLPVFRLSPPKKGYEGIKSYFPKGALGNRSEKMENLLRRMM